MLEVVVSFKMLSEQLKKVKKNSNRSEITLQNEKNLTFKQTTQFLKEEKLIVRGQTSWSHSILVF